MQDHQPTRRYPVGVIAGLSVLLVATGSSAAFLAWHSTKKPVTPSTVDAPKIERSLPSPTPALPTAPSAQASKSPAPKVASSNVEQTVQVYWLKDDGDALQTVAVPIRLKSADSSEVILTTAIETLLAGTADKTLTTTIPQGTQLRNLQVKSNGIHIDLSKDFTAGGGSASMMGRVAQVLYTATSLNAKAPVFISVEGKLLETLGGEGLMLEQPLTRQGFENELIEAEK